MATGTNGNDALYSDRPSTNSWLRLPRLSYDRYLYGLGGNDSLYGASLNDILSGGEGDDVLFGEGGNDTLNGGSGNDTMFGGVGDDLYSVDSTGDLVIEALNGGIDTVESSIESYRLGDNIENLILKGNTALWGTGNSLDNQMVGNGENNAFVGMEGNDSLWGNAGDDQLVGRSGDDLMVGGIGNDTYWVEDRGDRVVEDADSGTDSVIATVNYALSANVENLYLSPGSSTISGSGNALNNFIGLANTGSDRFGVSDQKLGLFGWDGDDTLEGGSGNDLLHGGTGNDLMRGGAGDDTYTADSFGDIVIEQPDNGIDTVLTITSYTLPDNVENLTVSSLVDEAIDGTGNALNNVITGNDGDNKLDGVDGNDTIYSEWGNDIVSGGNGNDVLFGTATMSELQSGKDADTLTGGAGDDRFVYTSFNFADNISKNTGDIITDFANGNDVLDLRDLLTDVYANVQSLIGDPIAQGFLRLVDVGGNTQVQIDPDGTETTSGFTTLVTVKGIAPDGLKIGQNLLVPATTTIMPAPAPGSVNAIELVPSLLG
ncbi:type I secretion C-terminal target domain-containing protein [Microcoleus sp. S13_C5]|uniref:type I secretion C-terminal target domain-containing protein n=1 Tax=Microcoleus sp. S13_C5 TaxID=3055411 RepID=UPI002FD298F8